MATVMKPFSRDGRFLIRRMHIEDLPKIMDIERGCYRFPWSEGIFRDCLKAGYSGFVLEQGEVMAGYVLISLAVDEAHLLNLCVHPDYRGQGHARSLLAHGIDHARLLGAVNFLLEVRQSNQVAIALYRDMGFNEIAIRPDYYPATTGREDALVMARTL